MFPPNKLRGDKQYNNNRDHEGNVVTKGERF